MITPVSSLAPPPRRARALGDPAVSTTSIERAADDPAQTATAVAKKAPAVAADDADAATQQRQLAALARQQAQFNWMAMERGELQREQESLDTLFLAQLKHDAEVLKEWLRLA